MDAEEEIRLLRIVALGLLVLDGVVTPLRIPIDGSYVARTMNGRPLPAELRIPVTEGDFRLFRLEQGVLRLGSDGRFTLYFRYYHQLIRRGARPKVTPVMADSETGTYAFRRGQLILTPARKKGDPARPPVAATIAGEEIRASYLLQDATANERVALVLRRDASYW